jgi:predicted dehydrogenase
MEKGIMEKIKLSIIGMGRMGITHYSIINSNPHIEIESVVDPSALVLSVISKYLPVKTFKDYNDLFKQTDPDAILVCTPSNLHFPIAKEAAKKGIHAFVEKPFTTKATYASELASLYADKALVNQVGYVNRFNDIFIKTKELVEDGIIGDIIRFKSEMFSCTITKSDDSSSGWRASRETGGGAVFEMASHAIDLVNFLLGKPDKIVGSSLNHIHSKKVEDSASATFLYRNGMSGTIYINWCDTSYRKPANKIELFGRDGRILADQHSLKLFLNKSNSHYKFYQGWNTLYITDVFKSVPFYVRGNEFTRQLYHFIECIQNREIHNQCSFIDGSNVLDVIESIFNDYEQHGSIQNDATNR